MTKVPDYKHPLRMAFAAVLLSSLLACGGGGNSSDATNSVAVNPDASPSAIPYVPSYYGDTRNIIDAKCVSCHREQGLAPFPLSNFEQISSLRSAMVYSVESQTMPPEGYAQLTDRERSLLLEWLAPSDLALGQEADQASTPYTWWRDAKPIVEQRCALCHVEDGLAPFPLQNLSDVVGIRAAAQHSIENGSMPPWNPSNGYTPLQHNLSLPREEKAILLDWLAGGAPEGNPADERKIAPQGLEQVDWQLKLTMPQVYTPTIFPDEYRCFVVDWPETEAGYITASTFQPKFAAQIHHVFVTIIPPDSVASYKAAEQVDDKPGYSCFGDTRIPDEIPTSPPSDVLGWGPGINSKRLPVGTGIQIAPGSALALQIHFNTLTTEPLPEQSSMVFVTQPEVERPGATAYILDIANWVFAGGMLIPAGEDDVSFQYEMPISELKSVFSREELGVGPGDPIAIHRASLHMHTLGKSGRLTLVRADGTEQIILDARNWDFAWQNKYLMHEEILVQPEDIFRTQCVYDNTEENQPVFNGEALQVRDVRWGDGTTDEMCASTLFFTRAKAQSNAPPTVYIGRPEVWQTFAPGDLMPVELRLNNFVLEEPSQHHMDDHTQAGNQGHYHLYFDTRDDSAEHVTDWRQQPVIRVPRNMPDGIHRLRVSLRSSDHQAIGVEDSVEFRVKRDSGDAEAAISLIDHNNWSQREEGADPISEHRPANVDCPVSASDLENGALEVQTGVCNYLALHQPINASITKGDRIRLVLWHQQLRTLEPGRGHVALALNGETLWQQTVAIPSDGGFYDVIIKAPADIPIGSSLDFHLHNHGYNSWTLLSIELEK